MSPLTHPASETGVSNFDDHLPSASSFPAVGCGCCEIEYAASAFLVRLVTMMAAHAVKRRPRTTSATRNGDSETSETAIWPAAPIYTNRTICGAKPRALRAYR